MRALPEGITPDAPAPGWLRFVAVFTPEALFVHDIEALLAAGGLAALSRAHPGAEVHVLSVELRAL